MTRRGPGLRPVATATNVTETAIPPRRWPRFHVAIGITLTQWHLVPWYLAAPDGSSRVWGFLCLRLNVQKHGE